MQCVSSIATKPPLPLRAHFPPVVSYDTPYAISSPTYTHWRPSPPSVRESSVSVPVSCPSSARSPIRAKGETHCGNWMTASKPSSNPYALAISLTAPTGIPGGSPFTTTRRPLIPLAPTQSRSNF